MVLRAYVNEETFVQENLQKYSKNCKSLWYVTLDPCPLPPFFSETETLLQSAAAQEYRAPSPPAPKQRALFLGRTECHHFSCPLWLRLSTDNRWGPSSTQLPLVGRRLDFGCSAASCWGPKGLALAHGTWSPGQGPLLSTSKILGM